MSAQQVHDFKCPNCGGNLQYHEGDGATIKCPYCGDTVIVPRELRPHASKSAPVHTHSLSDPDTAVEIAETAGGIAAVVGGAGTMIGIVGGLIGLIVAVCAVVGIPIFESYTQHAAATLSTPVAFATHTPIPEPTDMPSPTPGFAGVVMKFGSTGTGPGKFTNAHGIAVTPNNHIFVSEYQGGRVQQFDAQGKFVSQILVGAQRSLIYNLAADHKGIVYIAADGQIARYDSTKDGMLAPFTYPDGNRFGYINTAATGDILAMWYQARNGVITSIDGHRDDLVQFKLDGTVTQVWKDFISSQTGDPELDTQIATDGAGNIYALSGEFGRAVFVFDRNGKFISKFGSAGNAPDQFSSPNGIAVDSQSRVYVGDSEKILVFDQRGRFLDTIALDGYPRAITINDKDEIFVVFDDNVQKLVLTKP
jgi:sugar lactone lactonase YvrE/DNA-directed RNA polymerase subunit RPC12/RpoP